jgi:hypothetical protein
MVVPAQPSWVEEHIRRLTKAGIQSAFQCYNINSFETVERLMRRGIYKGPLVMNWVAISGGMDQPNIYNLANFLRAVPDGAVLTVESSVRNVLPINMIGIAMGLHVRCGIEDVLWNQSRTGKMSSVEQIEQLVRISREFGRPIATGKQAREIMKIGVFYETTEESLAAANGFAPNRNGAASRASCARRRDDTVPLAAGGAAAGHGSLRGAMKLLAHVPTLFWVCVAAPAQVVLVSAVWAWLPSYLNRVDGLAPEQAALRAALVVLCGAAGAVVWGAVADRAGLWRASAKLQVTALLCLVSAAVLGFAFGASRFGIVLAPQVQFAVIALGGFFMTCQAGVVAAVVMDVVHPGVRSTGASVLSLAQNLLGLAAGPFIAGWISDAWSLQAALAVMPVFGVLAAGLFMVAARGYERDVSRAALQG